jgi:CyaY protein
MHLFDQLEDAFERGEFEELDLQNGILKIETVEGAVLIVSKHAPSCQIWLASPRAGGLHFDYDEASKEWLLDDGTSLKTILARELKQLADVKVIF